MNFAYVRQGAVARWLREIPPSLPGAPRLRSLTPGELAALGILPVVDTTSAVDPLTHRLGKGPLAVAVFADRVEVARPVEALSQEEIAAAVEALRGSALAAIDLRAEAVRLRYITPGAGQAATYLLKERQAEAYRDAGYQGAVPELVQAEMDATGMTAQEATELILAQRDAWVGKAAQIEGARRLGKIAVSAATAAEGIVAARDAAVSALEVL